MRWIEFVAREDLVGGMIETKEGGDIYRGPISAVTLEDGRVTIKTEWTETQPVGSEGAWVRFDNAPDLFFGITHTPEPRIPVDGRIAFSMPHLGSSVITPRGWGELALAEVVQPALPEGVQYDWEIVVGLEPKGYAEFRTADGKALFHGPVKEIRVNEHDFVEIHFVWLATVPLSEIGLPDGEWEVAPPESNPTIFPNLIMPFQLEDTPEKGPRLRFGSTNLLYLQAVEGLDPAKVRGLELLAT